MYAQLIPDQRTINVFFLQNFIFINGKLLSDVKRLVAPNDIIQLIVSN